MPSAGAVAALTVAGAAGLVTMTARFSDRYDGAGAVCGRAEELRRRATSLADADAQACMDVFHAFRVRQTNGHGDEQVREALQAATDVPLAIVDCARQVTALGIPLVLEGNQKLRGDALTAVTLAEAAAVSATHLVRLNTRLGNLDDEAVQTAEIWCAEARNAARQVLAAPA